MIQLSALKEKDQYNYVYIDPVKNEVHLLLPITGGETIGLDNTCQSTKELKVFFGLESDAHTKSRSARHILRRYKHDLEFDIQFLSGQAGHAQLCAQKRERLGQIENYLRALDALSHSSEITALSSPFADYPNIINQMLMQSQNCFAMHLCPRHEDNYLKVSQPLFKVKRGSDLGMNTWTGLPASFQGLAPVLRNKYQDVGTLTFGSADLRSDLMRDVRTQFANQTGSNRVPALIQFMTQWLQSHNANVPFDLTQDQSGRGIDNAYIQELMGFDNTSSAEEYADAILSLALNAQFWLSLAPVDPFKLYGHDPEQLSIMTQFFMAQINFQVKASGISNLNYGNVLDNDLALSNELADLVLSSLQAGRDVEDDIVRWVNLHKDKFGLTRMSGFSKELTSVDLQKIKARFREQYPVVKDLEEKDEFISLLSDMPGNFINHQNRISVSFAEFITQGFPSQRSAYFSKMKDSFRSLFPSHVVGGKLPHKNAVGNLTINVDESDLLTMLHEGNLQDLADMLKLKNDNHLMVIELISSSTLAQMLAHSSGSYLVNILQSTTDSQSDLDKINHKISEARQSTRSGLRITVDMARSLYAKVDEVFGFGALDNLSNALQPNKLSKALQLLDIAVENLQFSQYDGYVCVASADAIQKVQAIAESNQFTIHLSPEMAKSIYIQVTQNFGANSPQVQRLNQLSNDLNPDKILYALELLGIRDIANGNRHLTADQRKRMIEFNAWNGYKLTVGSQDIEQIIEVHNNITNSNQEAEAHENINTQREVTERFHLTSDMARSLYIQVSRSFGENSAEVRLLNMRSNQPNPDKIIYALELLGIRDIVNGQRNLTEAQKSRMIEFNNWDGYFLTARREEIARIREIHHSVVNANQEQERATVAQPAASAPAAMPELVPTVATGAAAPAQSKEIDVSYRVSQTASSRRDSANIKIFAPSWLQASLAKLSEQLQGTRINLPDGSFKIIEGQLTLQDLQIISRNESVNVTGHIVRQQYHDIPLDVILSIKDLVRQCAIIGKTQITHYGGYGSQRVELAQPEDIYLCDLIGLQFQEPENSGRLVLIGDDLPKGFLDEEIYQNIVGDTKPTLSDCAHDQSGRFVLVTGMPGTVYFDKFAYEKLVARDVILVATGLDQQATGGERINFKFLKYGAGFFSGACASIVNDSIADAVLLGLQQYLSHNPNTKIKCIELPFYDRDTRIEQLCAQYQIDCYFPGRRDALVKREGYITATTNCADPHAMPGNEMRYGSVDAAIGENCRHKANEFSATLNSLMQATFIQTQLASDLVETTTPVAQDPNANESSSSTNIHRFIGGRTSESVTSQPFDATQIDFSVALDSSGIRTTIAKRLTTIISPNQPSAYYQDLSNCPRVDMDSDGLYFRINASQGGVQAASRLAEMFRQKGMPDVTIGRRAAGDTVVKVPTESVKAVLEIFYGHALTHKTDQDFEDYIDLIFAQLRQASGIVPEVRFQ